MVLVSEAGMLIAKSRINIARIANAELQNCNQCLKCHKSAGLSCVAIVSAHCTIQNDAPVARKNPATGSKKIKSGSVSDQVGR